MSAAAPRSCRVAVVGAGPAGFYAAEALLRAAGQEIAVDLFDRLPVPYGLVRYGVAPDHPKLKQVTAVFRGIAALPGFRFFGNVHLGEDMSLDVLRAHYHAVIVTCGAERDRPLGIPGAGLRGVHGGMAFVGWYNGHPDRRDTAPDLSGRTAVVLGLGNVALDVARILAKPAAILAATDIADHAHQALAASRIDRVVVVARGGPAQARCTEKELREFGTLPDCVTSADRGYHGDPPTATVPGLFHGFVGQEGAGARRCHFHFGLQPQAIFGEGRVRGIRFARAPIVDGVAGQPTDTIDLAADLVIACIGSCATIVPGLPYTAGEASVAHEGGRVLGLPGTYVAGWIKRGASGTIGTNRADAVETVAALLTDIGSLPSPSAPADALVGPHTNIGRSSISFTQWESIDRAEVALGMERSKPREKTTTIEKMIAQAGALLT